MHRRADWVEDGAGCLDEYDFAVIEITASSRSGRETAINVARCDDSGADDAFDFGSDVEGDIAPFRSNAASPHPLITAHRLSGSTARNDRPAQGSSTQRSNPEPEGAIRHAIRSA